MKSRTKQRLFVIRDRHGFFWSGKSWWVLSIHQARTFDRPQDARPKAKVIGGLVCPVGRQRLKGGVS